MRLVPKTGAGLLFPCFAKVRVIHEVCPQFVSAQHEHNRAAEFAGAPYNMDFYDVC